MDSDKLAEIIRVHSAVMHSTDFENPWEFMDRNNFINAVADYLDTQKGYWQGTTFVHRPFDRVKFLCIAKGE